MKHDTLLSVLAFSVITTAAPLRKLHAREVPQEHSHNIFLDSVRTSLAINNPDNIQDPVFSLLGNAAAAPGQESIADTDCLHQATADQAFTNAKAAGDVDGMTGALIYAALERNTGKVGLVSVECTAIEAKNPEIAAISQHQDPASPGAAAKNKAVTLELAKQIASIGGDPQEALKSGTFAPGDLNDPTAKGNSCDTVDDEPGCIFTENLLVEDGTTAEIDAAVAGVAAPARSLPAAADGAVANSTTAGAENGTSAAASASTGLSTATASTSKAEANVPFANASTSSASVASGSGSASPSEAAITPASSGAVNNIQTFTGSLGGPPPPVISSASDRPFSVNGATFLNPGAALQRSCAIQHNACANAAKSGSLAGGVGQCDEQEKACTAASSSSSSPATTSTQKTKRALDFGTCTNPTIEFATGLDGRKEAAFATLADKCKASAEATDACAQGQSAAASLKGQEAADAFNAALGGANVKANAVAAAASAVVATSTSTTTSTIPTATISSTSAAASASGPSAKNIQSFTSALGGLPPPVIVNKSTNSDRPFSVNGNSFVNAAAALQRSCAIQHNACADAVNSGALEREVGQCEMQEGECNAATTAAGCRRGEQKIGT